MFVMNQASSESTRPKATIYQSVLNFCTFNYSPIHVWDCMLSFLRFYWRICSWSIQLPSWPGNSNCSLWLKKQPQFPKAQGFIFFLSEYFSLESGSTWAHILLESGFCLFACFWFVLLWYFTCTIGTALAINDKKSGIIPVSQGKIFISLEKYSEHISRVSWDSPRRTPADLCLMMQKLHSFEAGFAAKWPQEATRFTQ